MTDVRPLSSAWKERLGLASRRAPEFYENSATVVDTPHDLAIRTALDDLRLSGMLCVQGIPTIFLKLPRQSQAIRVALRRPMIPTALIIDCCPCSCGD